MAGTENHEHFQHDMSFSEYGDIDRMTGDGTTARSRAANAMAKETVENPQSFRDENDPEASDHIYS